MLSSLDLLFAFGLKSCVCIYLCLDVDGVGLQTTCRWTLGWRLPPWCRVMWAPKLILACRLRRMSRWFEPAASLPCKCVKLVNTFSGVLPVMNALLQGIMVVLAIVVYTYISAALFIFSSQYILHACHSRYSVVLDTYARVVSIRYEAAGVPRSRVLIKLAATWEGIQACRVLEREGITCNLTLIFGVVQVWTCISRL